MEEKQNIITELNNYMNFGFEIFLRCGRILNRIDGPGNAGSWLNDFSRSPQEVAIIPAYFKLVSEIAGTEVCLRTEMFPVNENNLEIPGKRREAALVVVSEKEARRIAQELGCEICYWSAWDEIRFIVIVNVENETDFPESDDWLYYCSDTIWS